MPTLITGTGQSALLDGHLQGALASWTVAAVLAGEFLYKEVALHALRIEECRRFETVVGEVKFSSIVYMDADLHAHMPGLEG